MQLFPAPFSENPSQAPSWSPTEALTIAILVRRNYWKPNQCPRHNVGNGLSHRSVPDIQRALQRGGTAVQVKIVEEGQDVGAFDGLVLPGGQDIHPAFYGSSISSEMDENSIDPRFDAFQIHWTRLAVAHGLPVLGICRGMQLINVALGGSLQRHIEGHAHMRVLEDPRLRGETAHSIRSDSKSQIGRVLGSSALAVNSIHHQSVERLAPGLRAASWSEDGTLEALEADAAGVFGLQFHPEDLAERSRFQNLFDLLVERADIRRAHAKFSQGKR